MPDALENHDRIYLEKLILATRVLLELGEDGIIPSDFEAGLWAFKDRVERVLLMP